MRDEMVDFPKFGHNYSNRAVTTYCFINWRDGCCLRSSLYKTTKLQNIYSSAQKYIMEIVQGGSK